MEQIEHYELAMTKQDYETFTTLCMALPDNKLSEVYDMFSCVKNNNKNKEVFENFVNSYVKAYNQHVEDVKVELDKCNVIIEDLRNKLSDREKETRKAWDAYDREIGEYQELEMKLSKFVSKCQDVLWEEREDEEIDDLLKLHLGTRTYVEKILEESNVSTEDADYILENIN